MTRSHALLSVAGALFSLTTLAVATHAGDRLPQANDPYYTDSEDQLEASLRLKPNTGRAKNVILFIGDGMGITTVTASRIYQGQKAKRDGVSNKLVFESLPYSAFSRTYSHDSQVTDSAPSAAAMTTGVKSRNGTLGEDLNVPENDCAAGLKHQVTTIAELAEQAGMATGAVTTTRVTHATPAATYAHTAGRDWESDADMPDDAIKAGCIDIARQLVEMKYGDGLDVVMGGGRDRFFPVELTDPEYPEKKGMRKDRKNLVEDWLARYSGNGTFVWNRQGFNAVDPAKTGHLLALFEPSHMQFEADHAKDKAGEPSLAEMTAKAIDILKRNRNGYFLMVEGGRIDHAHHAGNAARALEDTVAFDNAVKTALASTSEADTLVIVTADHSHVLTMSGYPSRNNPILGKVDTDKGSDAKPYTTLSYANGPGATVDGKPRDDLSDDDTTAQDFKQQSLVPLKAETHGGEDVPIYAMGPWAHLFHGTVDQQYIFHVMNYATQLSQRVGKPAPAPVVKKSRRKRH
ncbi:MAG: alkaline phosphatase [Micropepsaceae bacterium]